ncbi:MAG: DUF1284 domain-containing protein [Nanoarchaeota archaeon]
MVEVLTLRGHHVANLAWNYFNSFADFFQENEEYGKEFSRVVESSYKKVISSPELEVRIVKGLDSLCEESSSPCPLREAFCLKDGFKDRLCIEKYDLVPGRVYSAKELLDKIEGFRRDTGFITPIEWFDKSGSL